MLPSILLLLLGGQSEQLAIIGIVYRVQAGFPGGSAVKNLPVMQETQEMQFDPWVGKILWRRVWQPIPAFCLENLTYRGTWWATVHRVTQSQTQLKRLRPARSVQAVG